METDIEDVKFGFRVGDIDSDAGAEAMEMVAQHTDKFDFFFLDLPTEDEVEWLRDWAEVFNRFDQQGVKLGFDYPADRNVISHNGLEFKQFRRYLRLVANASARWFVLPKISQDEEHAQRVFHGMMEQAGKASSRQTKMLIEGLDDRFDDLLQSRKRAKIAYLLSADMVINEDRGSKEEWQEWVDHLFTFTHMLTIRDEDHEDGREVVYRKAMENGIRYYLVDPNGQVEEIPDVMKSFTNIVTEDEQEGVEDGKQSEVQAT